MDIGRTRKAAVLGLAGLIGLASATMSGCGLRNETEWRRTHGLPPLTNQNTNQGGGEVLLGLGFLGGGLARGNPLMAEGGRLMLNDGTARNVSGNNGGTNNSNGSEEESQGVVYQPVYVNQSGIKRVWVDWDSTYENQKGIMIHNELRVENFQGKDVKLIAYFYHANGEKLMDLDGVCSTPDGQVAVEGSTGIANYQDSTFPDYRLFIPHNQIDVKEPGKHSLEFRVFGFFIEDGKYFPFTQSEPVHFEYEKGKEETHARSK